MAHDTEVPPQQSPMRQVAVQVGHLWWVPLVAGLLSIGLGLGVLATDWTVQALVVLAGCVLILRGLALAFNPSYATHASGQQVVAGIVAIVAGVVLIAWPSATLLVLAVTVGLWLTLSGCFHIVTSVAWRRQMTHWGLGAAIGVAELVLGLWVVRRPDVTLNLVITVIGVWAVVTGVIYCIQALEMRTAAREAEALVPGSIDIRDRPDISAQTSLADTERDAPRGRTW